MSHTMPCLLLVEDNEDDVFIFRRAFARAGLADPVHVARDGEEAVSYLGGTGPFADRERYPLPYLVFLDLKLPRRSGLDVLRWVNEQGSLRGLPIIVLTSSAEHRDVERTRDFGAMHYLVKPPSPRALSELVETHRSGFGIVAATDGARPHEDRFGDRALAI